MPGRSLISLISTIFCFLRASAAFFCSCELEFAVVQHLADRRIGVGHDLDQIDAGLFGDGERLDQGHDAAILAFGVDQLDVTGADFPVGARTLFLRGRRSFHRTANGSGPMTARAAKTKSSARRQSRGEARAQ
jgi:hypothetical protein